MCVQVAPVVEVKRGGGKKKRKKFEDESIMGKGEEKSRRQSMECSTVEHGRGNGVVRNNWGVQRTAILVVRH